jgi:hypothetical protein
MSKDLNCLLDLDNTIIYSLEIEKVPKNMKNHWINSFKSYEMTGEFLVFERPGLQKFLDWLFKYFNVSVWSAASPSYVDFIVDNIIEKNGRRVEYVLNSNNCKISQKIYGIDNIKKLDLIWDVYDLKGFGPYSTLIIDDLGKVTNNNKHNSIRIKRFVTNENTLNDNELVRIKKELIQVLKHYKYHINDSKFKLI